MLKFSFVLPSHNNFQCLSFFQSLFLCLCYRQNNLFTHLRTNWSRVRYLRCTLPGPGTFPRTRSKPRCKEANIRATSIRPASRIRARSRGFQATVQPRRPLRAQRCVIMWRDHKPRPEERLGLCRWSTKTPYRTIKSTTRRNGWVWLLFQVIKKSFWF